MLKIINILILSISSFNSALAIEDIKGIKDPMVGFKDLILYQFFIVLLFIVIYLYYRKKSNKKNKKKTTGPNENKKILDSLKKLRKHCDKIDKSIFYFELNKNFRNYFTMLGIKNSDTLTLSSIKKTNLDKSLINLFEKSYLYEFKNEKDTNKIRIDMIDKLIRIIK